MPSWPSGHGFVGWRMIIIFTERCTKYLEINTTVRVDKNGTSGQDSSNGQNSSDGQGSSNDDNDDCGNIGDYSNDYIFTVPCKGLVYGVIYYFKDHVV